MKFQQKSSSKSVTKNCHQNVSPEYVTKMCSPFFVPLVFMHIHVHHPKSSNFGRRIFWHLRKLIVEWENENQTSGFWIIQNKIRIYTDLNGHYYDTILFISYTARIIPAITYFNRAVTTSKYRFHSDFVS